ncbi:UNVERIFIED_CONTAM: hypothetical protein Slati_3451300 [Sesamum latifolium]|uniref:Uncharacterized protein n=1 Tax=Sesamum latifolium TaxID=2727402 RepID=A0AAW2UGU3_9LAMI
MDLGVGENYFGSEVPLNPILSIGLALAMIFHDGMTHGTRSGPLFCVFPWGRGIPIFPHGLVVYGHSGWDLVLAAYQVHSENGDNICSSHDSWRVGSDYLEGGPRSVLF